MHALAEPFAALRIWREVEEGARLEAVDHRAGPRPMCRAMGCRAARGQSYLIDGIL
jgi:hypothetical protein